jgi:hypothetical protein
MLPLSPRKWNVLGDVNAGRTLVGKGVIPLLLLRSSFQHIRERLCLAFSRKMRPSRILTQPIENRKNADTRGNVSTCWERIIAPILNELLSTNKPERKKKGHNIQAFEDTKSTESERGSEHREVSIEKLAKEVKFRQDERDDFEYNQKPIDDSPEDTSGFVRYRASPRRKRRRDKCSSSELDSKNRFSHDIVTILEKVRRRIARLLEILKRIDRADIFGDDEDAA